MNDMYVRLLFSTGKLRELSWVWEACSPKNGEPCRTPGLRGENRVVPGPIISRKMNLKKPGYQFKQEISPHLLPLSAQILVLEEFRALVSAECKFTQTIKLNLLLHPNAGLRERRAAAGPSGAGTPLQLQPCVSWRGIPTNSPDPLISAGSFPH